MKQFIEEPIHKLTKITLIFVEINIKLMFLDTVYIFLERHCKFWNIENTSEIYLILRGFSSALIPAINYFNQTRGSDTSNTFQIHNFGADFNSSSFFPQTFCDLFTASAFNLIVSLKLSKSKFVLNFSSTKKRINFMELHFNNLSNENFKTNECKM